LLDTVRDGVTGLLVPPGEPNAFAKAIVELLQDEDRRRRMGVAGREWVGREYEWWGCVDRLIAVYDDVIGQSPVARGLANADSEVSVPLDRGSGSIRTPGPASARLEKVG
jgi:hypothetical protein